MVRCGKELIKYNKKGQLPCCGENNQWILWILKWCSAVCVVAKGKNLQELQHFKGGVLVPYKVLRCPIVE